MRLIDADKLCEDLLERWNTADTRKEELIRAVMADIVTPIIVCQPTIEPERKTGKWIKISPANIYECSRCGKNIMTDDISAYDFCHGCGSYNGGEQDEND